MSQLALFPILDEERTDEELVRLLKQFGWHVVNGPYPATGIRTMDKNGAGHLTNMDRDGMLDYLEKERLEAAGDWIGALYLIPRRFRYLYEKQEDPCGTQN
jgi:hypothetical protein